MRCTALAVAAAALVSASAVPAFAWDQCHSTIAADGRVKNDKYAAMSSAKWAWQRAAYKKHGPGYSAWWYSGDRSIDCWWDSKGEKFWCTARARPCGKI